MKYSVGILLGIVLAVAAAYVLFETNLVKKIFPNAAPVTLTLTVGNKATPIASPVPVASPSPTPSEEDTLKVIIKAALVAKHGQDANSLNITVTKIEGSYASGMASATGGGGLWYAARINNNWNLVWDGNGTVSCSDLNPYPSFPTDLISQCWNSITQTIVNR